MPRLLVIAAGALAISALAAPAFAQQSCALSTEYVSPSSPVPTPTHLVSFVFTGVEDEQVLLRVDEVPVFEARLTTEDPQINFSGSTQCLMNGRYWINVKIGEAEGDLYFDISEETTIYLSARSGVLEFNIWGPNPPGLY